MAVSSVSASALLVHQSANAFVNSTRSIDEKLGKHGKFAAVSYCLDQNQQVQRLDKLSLSLSYKPASTHITRARSASLVCVAALNARCGAEGQTQTLEKPTSVIINVPGKKESPLLDDGGTGLPPRDDSGGGGDGGGGGGNFSGGGGGGNFSGGGGGGNFSGGFFFYGFLAFLGFLKDDESEVDYRDSKR